MSHASTISGISSSIATTQTINPAKYDFVHHNAGLLHGTPPPSISGGTTNVTNTTNSDYMHSNNLQQQLVYGNVKSESNAANYDYMNSCLQSGYFNSSFGTLGGSPSAATHSVSDLAGYHHQHIQAAKLMATS